MVTKGQIGSLGRNVDGRRQKSVLAEAPGPGPGPGPRPQKPFCHRPGVCDKMRRPRPRAQPGRIFAPFREHCRVPRATVSHFWLKTCFFTTVSYGCPPSVNHWPGPQGPPWPRAPSLAGHPVLFSLAWPRPSSTAFLELSKALWSPPRPFCGSLRPKAYKGLLRPCKGLEQATGFIQFSLGRGGHPQTAAVLFSFRSGVAATPEQQRFYSVFARAWRPPPNSSGFIQFSLARALQRFWSPLRRFAPCTGLCRAKC